MRAKHLSTLPLHSPKINSEDSSETVRRRKDDENGERRDLWAPGVCFRFSLCLPLPLPLVLCLSQINKIFRGKKNLDSDLAFLLSLLSEHGSPK